MVKDWPFVGRASERAQLLRLLAKGRAVLVSGPGGVGKSQLVRVCIDDLGGRAPARWVYCTETTAAISLGALAPLLPRNVATRAGRPSLLVEVGQTLAGPAGDEGIVVVVDDVHLLDGVSAMLVTQLAARSRIRLILTARSDETLPRPVADAIDAGALGRLDLAPLPRDDIASVLTIVLGGPVDLALVQQLWRASEGNPLYLRELLTAASDAGVVEQAGGRWRIRGALSSSARLSELVESRLTSLDAGSRQALEVIALGEPLALQVVRALVPAAAFADLEHRALLRTTDDTGTRISLAHAVYGEVVRARIPRLRARQLQRAIADAVEQAGPLAPDDMRRVARWRLDSGAELPVPALLAAARASLDAFDVDLADRCARAAHRRAPSAETAVVLANVLANSGEHKEAETLLAGYEDAVEVAQARAHNLFHGLGRYEEAVEVSQRAEARVSRADDRRRLACHRASFELCSGQPRRALEAVIAVVPDAREEGLPVEVVLVGGEALALVGQFDRSLALLRELDRAEPSTVSRFVLDPSSRLICELFVAVHAGHPGEVPPRAVPAHGRAIDEGAGFARGWLAYLLGSAALLEGRPATAEPWFEDAVAAFAETADPRTRMAWAGLLHAVALLGDFERLDRIDAQMEQVPRGAWRQFEGTVSRARAWADVCRGDVAAAAWALSASALALQSTGAAVLEADVLHDLVRLGRAEPSQVERLLVLATAVDGDLMAARAAHASALQDAGWAALVDMGERFAGLGASLLAAEAMAIAADRARRAGRRKQAGELAARSAGFSDRCEGALTPPLIAARTDVPLTGRERDIALLAAQGRGNDEIAERLGLSRRTVENHLARVFAKLAIDGRGELEAALGLHTGGNE